MKKTAAILVILGGALAGYNVFANVNFDEHDEVQEGAEVQEVVVPDGELIDDARYRQYQEALEKAMQEGDPNRANTIFESQATVEPSPDAVIGGADELPFTLLDVSLDRDQDGLSDGDEIMLTTSPNNADSDGDGFIDGLEVVRGYNPLAAGPGDKIEYSEPVGTADSRYKITGIRLTDNGGGEALTISGTGPINSLVIMLLFSDENRVWVARTDTTGRFLYTSADALGVGEYRAFAASASVNGRPVSFSGPLNFERTESGLVKKAEPSPTASSDQVVADEGWLEKNMIIIALAAIGGVVIVIGGVMIVWILKRKPKAQTGR